MTNTEIPSRFPKVAAPYFRSENEDGNYTIDPWSVKTKFQWVFDKSPHVEAIEKLDGTNCAVKLEYGDVVNVVTRMGDKRMQYVEPYGRRDHQYIVRGVQNSINRGYLSDYDWIEDGWHFGELVGPKMQGNPHKLDEHLFIPFEWLRDKCEYTSYGKYNVGYDSIRDWFKGAEDGLFSLFASRIHGQDLEASLPKNGTFVEGIIFIHPNFNGQIRPSDLTLGNDGMAVKELAKVRRDMFSPYYSEDWPLSDRRH